MATKPTRTGAAVLDLRAVIAFLSFHPAKRPAFVGLKADKRARQFVGDDEFALPSSLRLIIQPFDLAQRGRVNKHSIVRFGNFQGNGRLTCWLCGKFKRDSTRTRTRANTDHRPFAHPGCAACSLDVFDLFARHRAPVCHATP
jgi:hypothetical protein